MRRIHDLLNVEFFCEAFITKNISGESTTGKTSIVQQFINAGTGFPKNYSMTLGVDVLTRTINIPDSSDAVELIIIDCSGKTINNDILSKVDFLPMYEHRTDRIRNG